MLCLADEVVSGRELVVSLFKKGMEGSFLIRMELYRDWTSRVKSRQLGQSNWKLLKWKRCPGLGRKGIDM